MGTQLPLPQRSTARPIFGRHLLWPNGCMDQDATWYGGRPRPRRLCVRWGPRSHLPKKTAEPPNFRPTPVVAKWLHVSRCHLVRLREKRGTAPSIRPMSVVVKRLDGQRCHLVWGQALAQATLCSMRTQVPPEKGHTTPTQFLVHVYCGQMAGWMKTPLGTEVDLGPGHIVLDRVPALRERGTAAPPPAVFLAHVYCGMLPMSIAWFSSGMLTIGRIAYRREGVMRCSVIYDCLLPLPVQLIAWSKTLSLE